MMEYIEVKTQLGLNDAGEITGLAWPFGSPDMVGDEILPGAFKALSLPMPMLFSHDQRDAIGVWSEAQEDDRGLTVKGRLLVDDVERACEVRALIKAGALSGLSIGFITKKSAPRKGGGRTISELDILEISVVPIPAHPGARIESTKGEDMTTEITEEKTLDESGVKTIAEKAMEPFIERLAKVEAKANRPAALEKKDEPTEARKEFQGYLQKGDRNFDAKALNVSEDAQGGYIAPPEFSSEIIRELTELSPIRQYASVRSLNTHSVLYPKRASITNATWKGETVAADESAPGFGQVEIDAKELTTFVDVSNQLIQDSGGTAETEVRLALSEDFAQKEGAAFVNGSGNLDPEGFMTNPDIASDVSGDAATITPDAMIDMLYALPATYRKAAIWGMNGTTLAAIRKLKDGDGRFLWQQSFVAGQPETILGRPVIELPDMPDIEADAFPIILEPDRKRVE